MRPVLNEKDINRSNRPFTARVLLSFVLLLMFGSSPLKAQFYNGSNMTFGKNRVQWDNTIWTFYRFDDFDTYFYLNGKELALYTTDYARQQIPLLERQLQSTLDEKIQFIIFNSLSDYKQSNIGLSAEKEFNTGGITQILGTKVVVYFDGNYVHFEQQIRAGIAEMLINQLMFGGSIGSQIRNTALFTLPDWYKNGILSFLSEEWDSRLDDRLREGITSGRYKKLNKLAGEDALIAGHSFWRYINEQYGPSAVPDILHLTQMSRNIQNGFLYVTGVRYKTLISNWYSHYQSVYEQQDAQLPTTVIPLKYRTYRTFERPSMSPDGNHFVFVTNDEGKMRLWWMDLKTGKKRKLYKTGFSSDDKIDNSYPLIAWHPSSRFFTFLTEEKGKILLHFYNLDDGTVDERNLFDFQKVSAMSFAASGSKMVFAATRQGKPDIYLFDLPSNTHEQITDDYYTDLDPVFAAGDKRIIFSSNRPIDTLQSQTTRPIGQSTHFDLFSYDLTKRDKILQRIDASAVSNEIKPLTKSTNGIYYLSDRNGYFNLYEARFDSAISFVDTTIHYRYFTHNQMLTNYTTSILDYSNIAADGSMVALLRRNNKQQLFQIPQQQLMAGETTTTALTPFARERLLKLEPKAVDSTATVTVRPRKRFKMLYRPVQTTDSLQQTPLPARQGAFGIMGDRRTDLRQYDPNQLSENDTVQPEPKRRNYNVEYFYDELVTQVDFTYINYSYQAFSGGGSPIYLNPGFNVFLGVNLTDLLEDYRISGGVRLNTNLINNEYAVSFSNLRKRLDKHVILHRQSVENLTNTFISRTHSHEAFYMLSWPFNEVLSLRGTAIYRNDMTIFLATDQVNLKKNNTYENWGGLRTELVYDNSKQIGMNLHTGSRGKVFAEYFQLIDTKSRNFVVLGFDYRHYERIHRNFIWANRIAGSTSLGTDKLIYYMGGVDNWLFPSFNRDTPIDYGQNYIYQTLATNMRGFNQNIRNGNSFVVLNSELRFPVFSYLFQNPISSDFIRNFQLIAFGDLGTAWTGLNPYDPANSLYTSYIENGPLTISVEIQKDPIVGGIGTGVRTTLLGYFVRADVAWGLEDRAITKPVFYLSLSLDF